MSGWPRLWLRVPAIKYLSCSALPSAGTVADTGVSVWQAGQPKPPAQHSLCSACSQSHSMEFQQTSQEFLGWDHSHPLHYKDVSPSCQEDLDWKVMKWWHGRSQTALCTSHLSLQGSPRKKTSNPEPFNKTTKTSVSKTHTSKWAFWTSICLNKYGACALHHTLKDVWPSESKKFSILWFK